MRCATVLDQHPRLVPFQAQARGLSCIERDCPEGGEEREQFLASGLADRAQRNIAGVKALGGNALGVDDLVAVEHQVDIGDVRHILPVRPPGIGQIPGRQQDLVLPEEQLCLIAGEKQPVLR